MSSNTNRIAVATLTRLRANAARRELGLPPLPEDGLPQRRKAHPARRRYKRRLW